MGCGNIYSCIYKGNVRYALGPFAKVDLGGDEVSTVTQLRRVSFDFVA
jgi:hypothetical protein